MDVILSYLQMHNAYALSIHKKFVFAAYLSHACLVFQPVPSTVISTVLFLVLYYARTDVSFWLTSVLTHLDIQIGYIFF